MKFTIKKTNFSVFCGSERMSLKPANFMEDDTAVKS